MTRIKLLSGMVGIVLATLLHLHAAEPAADTNQFHSPAAGFTIVKSKDWQFASAQQIATNRANVRFKDKELEDLVKERANAPLIVLTKHPEPHDDLNPSVQVTLRPLGQAKDKSAAELLRMVVPSLQKAMPDFTFVEEVKDTKVAELPAAFMKAKYTVANAEGREFKTLTRMWIVPRGAFMFMMSMSGPQEGGDVSEKEFAAILDSIKIDK